MDEGIFENATILAGGDLEPVEGYLSVQGVEIEEIGRGSPPSPGRDLDGALIIPPLVNAHTHLGDSVRKELYCGRAHDEVVGEGGEKFRALGSSSDDDVIVAMGESLLEMRESGILAHCDFREGGMEGVDLLRRAEVGSVRSIVLSRPSPDDEIHELLAASDGIGLPSLDFLPEEENRRIAAEVSGEAKLLSLHVSETEAAHGGSLGGTGRSEVERALDLDPSFLVHGTWASREDLRSMREAGVPLVLCPRSNFLLNAGIPPVKEALEEGVELWMGTDNVTACTPTLFRELSFAWAALRLRSGGAGSREARELLKAATVNPTDDLDLPFGPIEEGGRASFVVLSRGRNLRRCEDPFLGVVNRARKGDVEMVVSKDDRG